MFSVTFTDVCWKVCEVGGKLLEGVITTPYAHACLAAGEAEAGSLGDETCVISCDLKGFRELAVEAVKALRL